MKRSLILLTVLLLALSMVALTACGKDKDDTSANAGNTDVEIGDNGNGDGGNDDGGNDNGEPLKEITGVIFANVDAVYDGTAKEAAASGLPEGVTAEYKNNIATDAGTYTAEVTLSGEGYETKVMTATITIAKADITGVSLADGEAIVFDGSFHFPTLSGVLPTDAQLSWYFDDEKLGDGVKAIGSYNVRLVISCKNYNDLTLTASFKIKADLSGLANAVINAFGDVPEAWSFLPESFGTENFVIEGDLPTYVDFTNVSDIPTNYIGKQMNVVYGLLNKCDTALGYVNTVHGAFNVIEQVYQTFLSNSPDDYSTFTGSAGAFSFTIVTGETEYLLYAEVGGVNVLLTANLEDSSYGARIQLTETTVLKYEVNESGLKIALNVLNTSSTQVEFVRDAENTAAVNGYIYEYLTIAGKELMGTSAYLHVGEEYTTVVGTKGDFIPSADGRNCEVYSNETGRLVGTEVSECAAEGKLAYDTLWYNLADISGIVSIKKVDKLNVLNPDTIYINGSNDSIHTKNVSLTDWSRRFDIEFKTVCAYQIDSETGEYVLVEYEVPMMFIQEAYADDFANDFLDKNKITVALTASDGAKEAVGYGYHTLVAVYNTIKESVTQQDIIDYCTK